MSTETEQKAAASTSSTSAGRSRGRRLGCGLILAGLLMILGWTAVTGWRLVTRVRSLQAHLQHVESLAGEREALGWGDLDGVRTHLAGLRADLEEIQYLAGPLLPAGRLLRWVPRHGGDLAAAADLLEVAVGAVTAGDRVLQALWPAVELLEGSQGTASPGPALIEQVLPILVEAGPAITAAQRDLAGVAEARARIDPGELSSRAADLLEKLDRALPALESALRGAGVAPWLLGAEEARTYLVLVQNSHELRATGGFVSGVGELHITGGRLVSVSFRDSYDVDNFQVPHDLAPQDFQAMLSGQLVFFRDTNWDPDFPTSARTAMAVYARDQGVEADGVLAMDLDALRLLLGALGPLQVPSLPEPVTAENVLEAIQAQWGDSSGGGSDLEWWGQRKDFMGPMAIALLERLVSGEQLETTDLLQAAGRALEEKHVLVYLSDAEAAALMRELNWDGALPEPGDTSDLVAVVDSNVGFNKVDAHIERAILYEVDLGAEPGPRARLTLTYRNRSPAVGEPCFREPRYGASYADLMAGCYWDYVRVYVPPGSRWVEGSGVTIPWDAEHETGDLPPSPPQMASRDADRRWTVWASFFELAPGEEQTVTMEYELPAGVLSRGSDGSVGYTLHVRKQPGTAAMRLDVEITLPAGVVPEEGTPGELTETGRVVTDLRTDQVFELAYREEASP